MNLKGKYTQPDTKNLNQGLEAADSRPSMAEPAMESNQANLPAEPAKPAGKAGPQKVVWRLVRVGAALLVLALMGWALYQNRQELWQAVNEANWGWLLLALALNLLGSLVYVAVWESCARQLEARGKLTGTLIALSMAGAARYLPGGIWPVAGLVYFAPEIGLPRRQVPVLAVLSQLVHLIGAGLAALISFGLLVYFLPGAGAGMLTLWLAALAGLACGVGSIIYLPRYIAPIFPSLAALIRKIKLGPTALYSLVFWLVNGVRLWAMVLAFGPAGGPALLYLVCTGAITTIVSAIFFFVPLGLGVVEFSLGWWLAQIIPWRLALAVVALNRLLRTLNDFLYFGLGLALVRLRRRH